MISLSALELHLLQAAATAHKVRRPSADLKVGDEVIVIGQGARYTATVTKIGPKWVTTGAGRGETRFSRATLHSEISYTDPGYRLYTPDQLDHDRRVNRAEMRLREAGVPVRRPEVSDGRVLALAALLELLGQADTTNGE